MKKRILAVVLCVAMLLSVVPFTLTAGATGATGTVDDTAKNILTVPSDSYIFYNNAGWDKPEGSGYYWGLARWSTTETATAPFHGQSSVDVNGEYMFKTEVTAEQACQPTYLPATYELNVNYDANAETTAAGGKYEGQLYGAQPISALYADAADYNYIAIRQKIVGDTVTPAYIHVGVDNANSKKCNWQNIVLINYTDSSTTKITASGTSYSLPANFDGWIVVPKSQFYGSIAMADVKSVGFRYLSNTNGKTFYQGDMKIVKDFAAFNKAHGFPAFDLTSSDASVTVVSDDTSIVYSLDDKAEASAWLNAVEFNATTANLKKETEYTVYAKYATSDKIVSKSIWTTPYGTRKGDGAYYLMNVYDDITKNPYIAYSAGQSPAGVTELGWPSGVGTLCKKYNDETKHNAGQNNSALYLREFDGETFIEFDKAEVYPEGAKSDKDADGDGEKDSLTGQPIATCVNQTVLADAITYGSVSTSGLHSSIDKTKLNYMAFRVKIEDPNNKTSGFYLYMNGRQTLTTLETAYTIDKATGAINTPDSWKKWNSKDFIFEGAFDGWVVVPLDVYGKDNITNGSSSGGLSILLYMHNGAGAASPCHDSKEHTLDGWDDKTLYIGDIVVFENENQFKSVHVCGAAGHVKDAGIRTEATCTADAYTTYNCSACKSVVTEVEEGTALNHKNKTTVEVPVTCYQDGYKKVTCPDCNTTLVDEKYTNRPQHTPSGAPVPKDPTCYADGSTGDIVCTVCAAAGYEYIFVAGTPITTRPDHTPSAERVGVVEATCTKEGYTGDIICTVCDAAKIKTVLNQGEETDKLSHVEAAELKNKVDATCSKKGYSGDVVCKDCGTTMVEGKETDMLKHEAAAERVDVEEAKCGVAGYTGDVVCKVCGYTMEEGEEVKALEHKAAADLKDKKEPTATDKGYTGDKVCELCGTVMEAGKEIAATGTTTGGATTPDDDKTEGDTTTGGDATTPDDDKTEGDATTGGDNTDGENAGAGSEDDGDIAPETGDNASILLAVVMALMAGAVVVLAKKRALNK